MPLSSEYSLGAFGYIALRSLKLSPIRIPRAVDHGPPFTSMTISHASGFPLGPKNSRLRSLYLYSYTVEPSWVSLSTPSTRDKESLGVPRACRLRFFLQSRRRSTVVPLVTPNSANAFLSGEALFTESL